MANGLFAASTYWPLINLYWKFFMSHQQKNKAFYWITFSLYPVFTFPKVYAPNISILANLNLFIAFLFYTIYELTMNKDGDCWDNLVLTSVVGTLSCNAIMLVVAMLFKVNIGWIFWIFETLGITLLIIFSL
jgi:hypothetical protein